MFGDYVNINKTILLMNAPSKASPHDQHDFLLQKKYMITIILGRNKENHITNEPIHHFNNFEQMLLTLKRFLAIFSLVIISSLDTKFPMLQFIP